MAGRKVYKIEATTKKGKESAASGVSKMTLWVDAKNWNMLGGEMEGTMGHMSWRTGPAGFRICFAFLKGSEI